MRLARKLYSKLDILSLVGNNGKGFVIDEDKGTWIKNILKDSKKEFNLLRSEEIIGNVNFSTESSTLHVTIDTDPKVDPKHTGMKVVVDSLRKSARDYKLRTLFVNLPGKSPNKRDIFRINL